MADKKVAKGKGGSTGLLDSIEEGIRTYWAWLLVLVAGYLIYTYGLHYTVIKAVIQLIGLIILGRIAWIFWLHYIQQDFISGIDFVLLEIVPPRDVLRSPKAMELFITNALYH